jgi:hypothetical protein
MNSFREIKMETIGGISYGISMAIVGWINKQLINGSPLLNKSYGK